MANKKGIENHSGKKSGKNNKMSKNICPIIEKFEDLGFVNRIMVGTYKTSTIPPRINILGYDNRTREYHVNVSCGKYSQKICLSVPKKDTGYEKLILDCL